MATTLRKLRVGLMFGGRSCEHEVSLASASSVMAYLDSEKYEIVPIGITKAGAWLQDVTPAGLLAAERALIDAQEDAVLVPNIPTTRQLTPALKDISLPLKETYANKTIDVVFPMLHGTYGEDGTLQGLLEMSNIPYVGCGVLGAALGMDKGMSKMVLRSVGLPIVDFLAYRRHEWEQSPQHALDTIEQRLNYPCFVKPANLGSSIGVTKVYKRNDLEQAMHLAARYDSKIIIEHAINCRELECSVLGNNELMVSLVGEVSVGSEFYDYHAKYISNTSYSIVPADLPQDIAMEMRQLAEQAFLALDLSGLARVDFFLEKGTGQIYINEVNTLPSFTPQCMYPKLCEAGGLSYPDLLDRLIELAMERYADRQRNQV